MSNKRATDPVNTTVHICNLRMKRRENHDKVCRTLVDHLQVFEYARKESLQRI